MLAIGTTPVPECTISQAAQGLASYLEEAVIRGTRQVLIARDPQPRSERLSRRFAGVLAANGIRVTYFPHPQSAAALSFAVRRMEASGGAMISAAQGDSSCDRVDSYDTRGYRLIAPEVSSMVRRIESGQDVREEAFRDAFAAGRIDLETTELEEAYLAAVTAESLSQTRDLSILVTPMYGVADRSVYPVLLRAGFKNVQLLDREQMIQQGIALPPGRLPDLENTDDYRPAIDAARTMSADLVLASDLAGGRLGAAVRSGSGEYAVLTSGQIAALTCDHVLLTRRKANELSPRHFIANSPIGTDFFRRLAGHYGVQFHHDFPTGFQYLARDVDAELPEQFVFAADHSHGCLKGTYCRERDAAVTAMLLAEHAAELKVENRTLLDELDALYVGHGFHADATLTWRCRDDWERDHLFHDFTTLPPERIGDRWLTEVHDYQRQEARSIPNDQPIGPVPTFRDDLALFRFEKKEDGFAVLPLQDEPVLKLYLFTYSECGNSERLPTAGKEAQSRLRAMRDGLLDYLSDAARRVADARMAQRG